MATPTLEELFTQLTTEQVEASALSVAEAVELPVTAWEPGSVGREIVAIFSTLVSTYLSGASTTTAAAGLLDYATGDWLHLTGSQAFETDVVDATFATCTEQLENSSTSVPYVIAANTLRFAHRTTGATYVNTTGGTLAAWSGSGAKPVLNLELMAESPGSGSNAAVGDVTEMVTPLAGVAATNITPAVGTDEEKDAAYRTRCREASSRLSPNGPRDAYNYFAKSAVRGDGSNCGVTRTLPVQPLSQPGIVIVYLASASGAVAPTDVAYVQANLVSNAVPTGITATAVSATARSVQVRATIYLTSGSTAAASAVQAAALAALLDYFQQLPIGGVVLSPGGVGYVFLDMIISTITASNPDQIVNVVVTNLGSDVALGAAEVAVLTSAATDFNVVVASS